MWEKDEEVLVVADGPAGGALVVFLAADEAGVDVGQGGVGVWSEVALRVVVDQPVECIDGDFGLLPLLCDEGDVHERERGVLPVGSVGGDPFELADGLGELLEGGQDAEDAAAGALHQGSCALELGGEHIIETGVPGVLVDYLLEEFEGLDPALAGHQDAAAHVEGLPGCLCAGVFFSGFLEEPFGRPEISPIVFFHAFVEEGSCFLLLHGGGGVDGLEFGLGIFAA